MVSNKMAETQEVVCIVKDGMAVGTTKSERVDRDSSELTARPRGG